MGLTGKEIHAMIKDRKEAEKQARIETQVGTYRPPPPLFAGLTHVSEIKPPRIPSEAQKKRNLQDNAATLERMLRNPNMIRTEREKLERQLADIRVALNAGSGPR